jgi:hypothetical protein
MTPRALLRPTAILLLLLLGAAFHACKGRGPSGPEDPDPTCETDSTLCTPTCETDSTLCPPTGDSLPVITAQPRDTTVAAGGTAFFTVQAQHAQAYQWVRLPADTLEGEVSSTLMVPQADSSLDSATYVCVVRNLKGTVASRAAILRVTTPGGGPVLPRNCAANPVVFTEYLMEPSLLKVVAQIGSIGGANTEIIGRSYIFPKDGQQGQRLLIRAPADVEVVAAKHYLPLGAPSGYVPDWSMYMDFGCGITVELYHVKDVSAPIKAKADTAIYPASNWEPLSARVKLRAGDTLGWYIPGINSIAFDFIVRNDSVTNQFANQARYVARNSNILHVVCPYDLYAGAKKDAYYALLGATSGVPVPGAGCGTVERDVAGTPAGQWFFDSTGTAPAMLQKDGFYGDPFPNIIGPDSTVYFGHLGPNNDVRIERSNPTWKRPRDIATEWCYQVYPTPTTTDGWVWLKMERADKMLAAYGNTGACPAQFPASGFKAYYR